VLGYLKSCVRETITGGTVTVGAERSEVEGGSVDRTTVHCDGGRMRLGEREANQFAGMVFRGAQPNAQPTSLAPAQVTLFGLSPMVELKNPGTLTIERLDRTGERYVFNVSKQQLVHGAFYDLAKSGKPLVAGGTYRATAGSDTVVFRLDPGAKAGPGPILPRLLRLPQES
jgi:hypothetical protein